jgi:hypothetical protein
MDRGGSSGTASPTWNNRIRSNCRMPDLHDTRRPLPRVSDCRQGGCDLHQRRAAIRECCCARCIFELRSFAVVVPEWEAIHGAQKVSCFDCGSCGRTVFCRASNLGDVCRTARIRSSLSKTARIRPVWLHARNKQYESTRALTVRDVRHRGSSCLGLRWAAGDLRVSDRRPSSLQRCASSRASPAGRVALYLGGRIRRPKLAASACASNPGILS